MSSAFVFVVLTVEVAFSTIVVVFGVVIVVTDDGVVVTEDDVSVVVVDIVAVTVVFDAVVQSFGRRFTQPSRATFTLGDGASFALCTDDNAVGAISECLLLLLLLFLALPPFDECR